MQSVKAVIYDLDGTIIDTDSLHVRAWQHAGKIFSFEAKEEQLARCKGLSSQKTLESILPPERYDIISEARDAKLEYFLEHLDTVQFLGNFPEAYEALVQREIAVGVCTSSPKQIIDRLLTQPHFSFLSGKIACKEMFTEGKPSAEPLYTTLRILGNVEAQSAVYVGDGYADYGSAQNAGIFFFYFCTDLQKWDKRIPQIRQLFQITENCLDC